MATRGNNSDNTDLHSKIPQQPHQEDIEAVSNSVLSEMQLNKKQEDQTDQTQNNNNTTSTIIPQQQSNQLQKANDDATNSRWWPYLLEFERDMFEKRTQYPYTFNILSFNFLFGSYVISGKFRRMLVIFGANFVWSFSIC